MSRWMRWGAAAAAASWLGCTWVPLQPQAEAVRARAQGDVSGCERIGKTHTRTVARVGFIPRSDAKVRKELETLARNEAVRMGGNAVSPLESPLSGEQEYGIYRCP